MNEAFDARGLKCPLAFVKAKQQLFKYQVVEFYFDDETSLNNFLNYLDKNVICYKQIENETYTKVYVTGR